MRLRFIATCFLLFIALAAPRAGAQTRVDTILVMNDGVKLEAFYMLPTTARPAAGWPAILFVHGFNGSMNDNQALAQSAAFGGYAAMSFSVRGQGASEGVFDFFTSQRVLADLSALIAATKALPGVNPDRVAVEGGSQGGVLAWAAAAHNLGVRSVTSVIANGRFDENWAENNALNWTFARAIGVATARLDASLKDVVNNAVNSGNITPVESFLRSFSTEPLEAATTTPVAIFVSYHDGFFNQSAALRQFSAIGGPKRIMTYPAGHTVPPVGSMRNLYQQQVDDWRAYWLKDDASAAHIIDPATAVVMMDGATAAPHVFAIADSAYWLHAPATLPQGLARHTWYLTPEGLRSTPPASPTQQTMTYANFLGSNVLTFRTEPLAAPMTIAGAQGGVVLRTDGTGSQYQVSVYLYDVNPATGQSKPIVRGHAQVAANAAGAETLAFDLTSAMHTVAAGHVIEARMHGGMALLPNNTVDFGNYVLGPVQGSANTLFLGGNEPSRLTLLSYDSAAVTAIAHAEVPVALSIGQNYPNPFNPSTTISYATAAGAARVSVHTLAGVEVAVLADGMHAAGTHHVVWNADRMSSGTYLCRVQQGTQTRVRLMTLLR